MAPHRKPPPRLTSPPPPGQLARQPSLSLHEGKDEYGRPLSISWGAAGKSQPTSRFGLTVGENVGEGEGTSVSSSVVGGGEGKGEQQTRSLRAPTPRRSEDDHALLNFEAAVAALRSTQPESGQGAAVVVGLRGNSRVESRDASTVVDDSSAVRGSLVNHPDRTTTTTTPAAPHYQLKRHQSLVPTLTLVPVDPNYPSTIQFHKQAGYTIPTARPVMAQTTRGDDQHHHNLPPVYRPHSSTAGSPGGLPLPVSMTRDGQGKRAMGLGLGIGSNGQTDRLPVGEDSPTSTTARRERNVSGPLRRRAGRRSRSPTPFPDDDDDDDEEEEREALDPGRGKENGRGRLDPFGPIEVDLASKQKAELTAIYDTAIKKEALRKGYAMYVDRDVGGGGGGGGAGGVGEDGERLLLDHEERDMAEVRMVPMYEGREGESASGLGDKRKSMDLVSYHTKDPRSSLYDPYDRVPDEKAGLDIGDYQHHDPDQDEHEYKTYGSNDDDDDDDMDEKHPPSTAHFGPAPVGRVVRRHLQNRAKKVVELTEGNLVIDLKIPTKLEGFLPAATRGRMGEDGDEVLFTRYSAVTSTPDNFIAENFTLRQKHYGRETELMIVITMYNEDEILFLRTLYGVMRNISHLEGRKNSGTWGAGSWKKVVVCIVADGRKNISPRVLDCLASLGVYQEGAMKNSVQDKAVQAHVFEYTCTMGLTPDMKFKFASTDKGMVPTQIIFCLKEKNAKKINSHRWFFNAFCRSLDPKVCILLDVGTRPGPKSLYHLWKSFDQNSQVGGCCGEIAVYKGPAWKSLLNPLVACQNFEYKISNVLDKTTESVFGYCAVLPGAFSAYRWVALQDDVATGKGPLASYFKGEILHGRNADMFTANMYLAEDRILCWEIVAKPKHNYVLKYVSAAVGETDAPETIAEFISQRRRWLNGSFFAAIFALSHLFDLSKTEHSFFRKVVLSIQALYNAIMLVFSWFSIANFYIFFVILTSALEDPVFRIPKISILNTLARYVYLGTVVACFIFSMGNRPQGSIWKYTSAVIIFAVLTLYMMAAAIVCMVQAFKNIDNPIFAQMIVSVVATFGVFIVASFLAFDPFHLLTSAGQYILFQASSINLLSPYAFSNTNDISWGTKGADSVDNDLGNVKGHGNEVEVELPAHQHDVDASYSEALDKLRVRAPTLVSKVKSPSEEEQGRKDYYANVRTNLLLCFVLSNALLASLILGGGGISTTFSESSSRTSVYMLIILIFVAATNLFRLIGAVLYLLIRLATRLQSIF